MQGWPPLSFLSWEGATGRAPWGHVTSLSSPRLSGQRGPKQVESGGRSLVGEEVGPTLIRAARMGHWTIPKSTRVKPADG